MTNIDEQFVDFIVKSLVSNPDEVVINRSIDEKGVLLELTVDPEDLGRVIGKRGATAQSIRTLLRALGTKNDARYNLKIVDNGEPREQHSPAPAPTQPQADEPTDDESQDDMDDAEADGHVEMVEDQTESLAEKTRKELDDLDDLDI